MSKRILQLLTLLSVTGIAAAGCCYASFFDAIGDQSAFQVGRDFGRSIEVGFDSYPVSGTFTAVRPVWAPNVYTNIGDNRFVVSTAVVDKGTSGITVPSTKAVWAVQPFTATASGNINSVTLIAQNKRSAAPGVLAELDNVDRAFYVTIVPASSWPIGAIPAPGQWIRVPFGDAGQGKLVSGVGISFPVVGAQKYYALIGTSTNADWAGSACYGKLNWAPIANVNDSASAFSALQMFGNPVGNVGVAHNNRVIGIKLDGAETNYPATKISDLKNKNTGDLVALTTFVSGQEGVGGVPANSFFVESTDGASGVRVQGVSGKAQNTNVAVKGGVVKTPTETYVVMHSISAPGGTTSKIYYAANKATVIGLTLNGMVFKCAGKVSNSDNVAKTFNLDNGADPVKCICGSWTMPADDTFVTVTGVIGLDATGKQQFYVRASTDIQ